MGIARACELTKIYVLVRVGEMRNETALVGATCTVFIGFITITGGVLSVTRQTETHKKR